MPVFICFCFFPTCLQAARCWRFNANQLALVKIRFFYCLKKHTERSGGDRQKFPVNSTENNCSLPNRLTNLPRF